MHGSLVLQAACKQCMHAIYSASCFCPQADDQAELKVSDLHILCATLHQQELVHTYFHAFLHPAWNLPGPHALSSEPLLQSEKLEHVGILHHNPQGQVAFFHRTSGGKVNPMAPPGQIFNADYTTVPLTAKVAWDMFDGAAESGNYRYPKDRIQAERLSHCTLFKGDQLLYTPSCGADELLQQQEMLPVSVLTDADLQGSQLQVVYDFSNAKFRELQEMMQLSDQQFLKQLAWYR